MTRRARSAIKITTLLRSSVQMLMLSAPDPEAAAAFYIDYLGFRPAQSGVDEAIVEGYGMQVVLSLGEGGGHTSPPAAAQAFEVPGTMERIETLWEVDRARFGPVQGPVLDGTGAFVYVSVDPAGNAVALVAPLPSEREGTVERVTQRLRLPPFESDE